MMRREVSHVAGSFIFYEALNQYGPFSRLFLIYFDDMLKYNWSKSHFSAVQHCLAAKDMLSSF
jgi:hypothetical protein